MSARLCVLLALVFLLGGCYSYQLSSIREIQSLHSQKVRLTTFSGERIFMTVQHVDDQHVEGSGLRQDLRLVKAVEVERYDSGRTILATAGAMLAVAATVFGIAYLAVRADIQRNGLVRGDGNWGW